MVREGKRSPVSPGQGVEPEMRYQPLPSPKNGLVLDSSLAEMPPFSAIDLVNGFPTRRGIRVRGGMQKTATIGNPVESLFTFRTSAINKLFAAGGGGIYDVTSLADPDVAPAPSITGQTSDYYSTTMFSAGGGDYVLVCNGSDATQHYDGTSWVVPSITGESSSTFSQVFAYRSRLFFVIKDTLKFAYLPVNSIAGAALSFELSGVFKRGGSLLFGATWSQDAGDGLDDKAVFVTDLGEVAIYQGSNPSDANDWTLVGRYDIAPPLGKNAYTYAGGDLVIMTQNGMVPISQAVNKEPSVLALAAVSRPIEPEWIREVESRILPWEFVEVPKLNMGLATLPSTGNQPAKCFVVNLQTSRWGIYTGWDARCVAELSGSGFFGSNDGHIYQMEVGGNDNGMPYLFQCAFAPDDFEFPAIYKSVKLARAVFEAYSNFAPQLSVSSNYGLDYPAPPNAGPDIGTASAWDQGLWDTAIFDGGLARSIRTKWQTVNGSGYSITPQIQALMANNVNPEAELIGMDLAYIGGELVV